MTMTAKLSLEYDGWQDAENLFFGRRLAESGETVIQTTFQLTDDGRMVQVAAAGTGIVDLVREYQFTILSSTVGLMLGAAAWLYYRVEEAKKVTEVASVE